MQEERGEAAKKYKSVGGMRRVRQRNHMREIMLREIMLRESENGNDGDGDNIERLDSGMNYGSRRLNNQSGVG